MATPSAQMKLSGLARKLVLDGLLSEADAIKAQDTATKKKLPLVSYLVESKLVASKSLAIAAAHEFGVPLLDIGAIELDPEVVRLVDEKLVRQHHGLPLYKRGNRLFIAVSDPTNLIALDEIKFHAGMNTEPVLVEEDKLNIVIEKAMSDSDTTLQDLDGDLDDIDISADDTSNTDAAGDSDVDDAPVVRFINKVLLDAINTGASDVHFEPYEKYYRVRYRRDGVLTEIATPPVGLSKKIAARLKVLSRLDIS